MMKIKHLVAYISLCTVLNFSNGYTANNTPLTLDDLNGAEISIFDNSDFWNQKVKIYTKPTENFSKTKVHKYFGDPSSEEVEVTNNNGFFQIAYDFLKPFKDTYDNATYGIAEYQGNYYAVLLSDNKQVNGKTYSKLVCILKNNDTDNDLSVLQRIPIQRNLDSNYYDLEDKLLGKGYNIFLISSLIPYAGIKDGPMVFYPNPTSDFKSAQVNKRIFRENSEDDIITVFNKDGRFAVQLEQLEENELNSYKKWCDGKVNYGVLKYNSNYYLVEYTKNYNAEDGNTDFNMVPIFFNNEFFKVNYINSDEYTQYVNKILHINNNKVSENKNNIINNNINNENYIQNEHGKNVKEFNNAQMNSNNNIFNKNNEIFNSEDFITKNNKTEYNIKDKEKISNINEDVEGKLNDIMALKNKLKKELQNNENNNQKFINKFARKGLDALYNNIKMRDYIIKGNEKEIYNKVAQYIKETFKINLSLTALTFLKKHLTNREDVERIMSNY